MISSLLPLLIASSLLSPTIERAFDRFESHDLAGAAALLDEAATSDPEYFDLNNLYYLRGRIAESLEDWQGAREAFGEIRRASVLHPLALWHLALTSIHTGDTDLAVRYLDRLPSDFPTDLRMRVADEAPDAIAIQIYASLGGREARWRLDRIRDDEAAMWRLLAARQTDEIALRAASRLDGRSGLATARQRRSLARAFYAHRVFDRAAAAWTTLLEDENLGPEAHYELGRAYFQQGLYDEAIRLYRTTVDRFPDTDWERDADYQIASCYWRKEDYPASASAYLHVIKKYDDRDQRRSAIRNLIDVYRVMGQHGLAHEWIDRALGEQPSTSSRQVLLFTRAKLRYVDGDYRTTADLFAELAGMRLRTSPNGTDRTEVRFFQAMSLGKLGLGLEAAAIWEDLAGSDPFSYYGLKSAEMLGDTPNAAGNLLGIVRRTTRRPGPELCGRGDSVQVVEAARRRRLSRTRTFLTRGESETDQVGELVFLHLWDEAFYWADRVAARWKDEALADLAYLASDFRKAMLYADRLRQPDAAFFDASEDYDADDLFLLGVLFPTAYADDICRESADAGVNPLWLRAIMWQESRFDPNARSGAAARGLMQFIPETAARGAAQVGIVDLELDDLYRPEISIRLGAFYWAELIEELEHPELALAAYNGGIENVRRWQAKSGTNDMVVFISDIGFVQTKAYVRDVFSIYAKYAHLSQNRER